MLPVENATELICALREKNRYSRIQCMYLSESFHTNVLVKASARDDDGICIHMEKRLWGVYNDKQCQF